MNITFEQKNVTPEMAKVWLSKNTRNRHINRRRVSMYAREMKAGKWMPHHQGIAFYDDGALADGQHRLAAIVESGVSVPMMVARGLPKESGLMIDGHQQRQIHQAIKVSGLADWIGKDEAATVRMMMQIEKGTSASIQCTHLQIIDYAEAHKEAIMFAHGCFKAKKRFLTAATTKACIASAYYFEDHDRLRDFCDVLVYGMPSGPEDKAAILIREFLFENGHVGGGGSRIDTAKRIMRAIKAFCEHQDIGKLYMPKDMIYSPQSGEGVE